MYKIIIKKKAKKFIDGLPQNERKRIVDEIEKLPNGSDIKKLKGHDGLLRLRVGSYRKSKAMCIGKYKDYRYLGFNIDIYRL